MPNVFVAQRPSYRAADNTWADKYDLTPAEAFGDLVECVPPQGARDLQAATDLVHRCVWPRFVAGVDLLLPLGDPALVGVMFYYATVLTNMHADRPPLRVLRWDRKGSGRYRVEAVHP